MNLNGLSDTAADVSAETQHRLRLIYPMIAFVVLSLGTAGILRVWRELGEPFGGFIWAWDPTTHSLVVDVQTPWDWPGPQRGLRGDDRILAIDGQDPMTFQSVYATKDAGDKTAYLALALLAMGSAALYYGHQGGISHFYENTPVLFLLFVPAYPLTSALLTHFFPTCSLPFSSSILWC